MLLCYSFIHANTSFDGDGINPVANLNDRATVDQDKGLEEIPMSIINLFIERGETNKMLGSLRTVKPRTRLATSKLPIADDINEMISKHLDSEKISRDVVERMYHQDKNLLLDPRKSRAKREKKTSKKTSKKASKKASKKSSKKRKKGSKKTSKKDSKKRKKKKKSSKKRKKVSNRRFR